MISPFSWLNGAGLLAHVVDFSPNNFIYKVGSTLQMSRQTVNKRIATLLKIGVRCFALRTVERTLQSALKKKAMQV
jgi:hypothetical protein